MCGINGCIHLKDFSFSKDKFKEATNLLVHRGPDSFGVTEDVDDRFVIKLGHQRLSILGIDESGNQPISSENNLCTMIYNGEIYNHISLRKEMGNRFLGDSDSETLVNLLETNNIDNVLEKIEGMFAFCFYDKRQQKITLVRDKSGEKPLYLSSGPNFFGFSSDLISLKEIPNFTNALNKTAVEKYLQHNYIPAPETIYKNSFKLPPGSYITIDLKLFEPTNYESFQDLISSRGIDFKYWWSLNSCYDAKNSTFNMSEEEVIEKTESLLEQSVSNQLISDVPLGAFLSGGIDSSLIVSLMSKHTTEAKTYTVGFDFLDYDESVYAEKIANHLGTKHTTYLCNKKDALDIIPNLPKAFSEPFADSSQIPTMLVSSLARQDVKVALSGDAGDEIFGGYNRYLLANKYWKYLKLIPPSLTKGSASLINSLPQNIINLVFSLLPISKDLSGVKEERIDKILSKLKQIHTPQSFYESMTREWTYDSGIINFSKSPPSDFSFLFNKGSKNSIEEAMMHADFQSYLPDDILCKVDRSSMFSSLETRTPFLNKDLIEFAYGMPLKYKIRDGKGKWVLRKILSKYIPKELFERPKQGFGIPISIWMRTDLKEWVNDILAKEVCDKHNMFNFAVVNRIKEEHFSGTHNNEHKLWSVIQFNQWYLENFS